MLPADAHTVCVDINPAVVTTGAGGEGSAMLTFGSENGSVRVSASANGSSLNFSAYACGGDASAAVWVAKTEGELHIPAQDSH